MKKKIADHMGEKITRADPGFTREITGFAIGGIPPLGHKQPIKDIFIDEDLFQFTDVWAAAGTPHSVFNLKTAHLTMLIEGKRISIK